MKAKKAMSKTTGRLRLAVQVFFFLLIAMIAINHTLAETGAALPFFSTASVHAVCPFGGVETLYQLATTGDWLQKIHPSAMILFGIVAMLSVLFGPVFCGWVCPMGSIQEWVSNMGRRIFKKRFNHMVPKKVDGLLRYLRYGFLALVLYQTAVSGKLLFENADPYYALFHFWTGETSIMALGILGLILALSLIVERPFCKYACPYGAVLGVTNLFRIFKIRRTASSCISCGLCSSACPMGIEVSSKDIVTDHQCISCLKCTSESVCPISETVDLSMKTGQGKTKKITALWISVIVLLLIFGGIAATSVFGLWQTEAVKAPSKSLSTTGETVLDPLDIKGSYTFQEIVDLYGINENDIRTAFSLELSADLSAVKSKNIETMYVDLPEGVEIGNEAMQLFVAYYTNVAFDGDGAYLPKTAVDVLIAHNGSLTAEQAAYLEGHTYDGSASGIPVASGADATNNAETGTTINKAAEEEPAINGNTTFYEVLDLGITQAQIEEVLGTKMPATNTVIKGFCQDNGLSFSEVKAALSNLLKP